ncbi:acyltransferase family protein [Cedecea neteri]|uniref:acyltransferase family protein n=1 Tax=Cedecea neteri TaxID=158822 RepID=UPI0008FF806C|nr:acyltransferase [Cedecea neteri]
MKYQVFNYLRIFLALEVVVAHTIPVFFENIYWPGFVMAVPAFLAVSGFLVLGSYDNNPQVFPFLIKRCLRIFPALIASIILSWIVVDREFAFNSILMFLTGGFTASTGNIPLWSLIWELLAYGVLIILWVSGAYKSKIALCSLLAISIGISYFICAKNYHPKYQILSFLPISFLIGNIFYLMRNVTRRIHFGYALSFFIFVLILFSSPWRNIPIAPSAAILQAIAVVWLGSSNLPLPDKKVPDISYGLYVYHYPIIIWIGSLLNQINTLSAFAIIVASLVSVCLSSWHFIESPVLNAKKIILSKYKQPV